MVDAGARLGHCRRAGLRRGVGHPVRDGADPQPLRAAHLHRAGAVDPGLPREGEAQRRAGLRRGQARGCWSTTRSCAARRCARSSRWCAKRRRARGAPAYLVPPPTIGPCHYGIDTPTREELIAHEPHAGRDLQDIIGCGQRSATCRSTACARAGPQVKHRDLRRLLLERVPVHARRRRTRPQLSLFRSHRGRRRRGRRVGCTGGGWTRTSRATPSSRRDRARARSRRSSPRCPTCTVASSASASPGTSSSRRSHTWRHARMRLPARVRHGDGPDARLRLHELGDGLRRPARVPDLGTLRRAAWLDRTAIVLCDALNEDRRRCSDSRSHLGRIAAAAPARTRSPAAWAPSHSAGSELEFFLFDESYASARDKGYTNLATSQHYVEDYHVLSSTFAEPVIGAIRRGASTRRRSRSSSARASGGPASHEINLRYAEALEMADRHVIYKLAAKEIAAAAGASPSPSWPSSHEDRWPATACTCTCRVCERRGGCGVFGGDLELVGATPVERLPRRSAGSSGGLLSHVRASSRCCWLAPTAQLVQALSRRGPSRPPADRVVLGQPDGWGSGVVGRRPGPRCASNAGSQGPTRTPTSYTPRCWRPGSRGSGAGSPTRVPAFPGDVYAAEGLPQVPAVAARSGAAAFESSSLGATRRSARPVVEHLPALRPHASSRQVDDRVSDVERGRYFERI